MTIQTILYAALPRVFQLWLAGALLGCSTMGWAQLPPSITEYNTGLTASSQPFGITSGPDGALWFTESFANQIARCALTTTNSHDFNADGKSDIAWRDTGGNLATWLMNGAQVLQAAAVGTADPTVWTIVGQRDFNGDGKADWLWRDTSGNVAMWFLNGAQVTQSAGVGNVPVAWTIVGTGDFDGDGKSDIIWRDTSGNVAMWFMNGAQVTGSAGVGNVPTVWSIQGSNAD